MEGEVVQSANDLAMMGKYIGAGIACFALAGAALGIGKIFSSYFEGAFRNPSASKDQFVNLLIGAALTEAAGILGFVIAFLLYSAK